MSCWMFAAYTKRHPTPTIRATPRKKAMDDDAILSLYEWATGACFRCARTDLDTTRLKELRPPAGVRYDVRACRACILGLEVEREHHAKRTGSEYVPGQLGDERKT